MPAIVPEALWEQANRLLASRGKTMKAHAQASQNRYAYSGKLICAKHGTTFHRHVYKSKSRGESECWIPSPAICLSSGDAVAIP